MSITVKSIDEFQMKKLLKDCPKEIQQYVKALKSFIDNSANLRDKQTRKIIEQAKEISRYEKERKVNNEEGC
jgi:hypothetical protein